MIIALIVVAGIVAIAIIVTVGVLIEEGKIVLIPRKNRGLYNANTDVAVAEARAREAYWKMVEHKMLDASDGEVNDLIRLRSDFFGPQQSVLPVGFRQ